MARSSIIQTPQSTSDIKRFRVLKERKRRSRETVAFHELRRTLEATDPKAFWRMEKVDIAEGAAYLIQKLAGVPIVIEEKCPNSNEKLDRIQVEKQRRKRESQAIKKLKQTLLTYFKYAHKRMERADVLITAAEFLTTLKASKHSKRPPCSNDTSPIRSITNTPFSSPHSFYSPTNSVDSGNSSFTSSAISPDLILLASLFNSAGYFPISPIPHPLQTPVLQSPVRIASPPAKKSRTEFFRPWM
ncbi:hypothetical protein PRIPAC_70317 [Pristionchus pacificus]|uniref:HLH domain containing protein n=1 Tax=Pristionchus pacificus TaxID=54126 RepID=A0A2A6CG52_PRIPA|nr:hypothetical protein PRIPAC_70317 [Pristionchus pacificus]|eukprot:PDM77192.1 HLH domain containing protein [Pristionchus pacificus]